MCSKLSFPFCFLLKFINSKKWIGRSVSFPLLKLHTQQLQTLNYSLFSESDAALPLANSQKSTYIHITSDVIESNKNIIAYLNQLSQEAQVKMVPLCSLHLLMIQKKAVLAASIGSSQRLIAYW